MLPGGGGLRILHCAQTIALDLGAIPSTRNNFLFGTNSVNAIILALMTFEQHLMAIIGASNGFFMPIIYPNYLLMAISYALIVI